MFNDLEVTVPVDSSNGREGGPDNGGGQEASRRPAVFEATRTGYQRPADRARQDASQGARGAGALAVVLVVAFILVASGVTGIALIVTRGSHDSNEVDGRKTEFEVTTPAEGGLEDNEPPTVTLEEFEKIREGMTYEEVAEVVGGHGELVAGTKGSSPSFSIYRWDGEGIGYVHVMFEENSVVSKLEFLPTPSSR